MDVDTIRGPERTNKEITRLRNNNACFYCEKPGHRANVCRKKQFDRNNKGKNPAKVTSTDANPFNMDNIAEFLKSETFISANNEAKLKVIDLLAPQDF